MPSRPSRYPLHLISPTTDRRVTDDPRCSISTPVPHPSAFTFTFSTISMISVMGLCVICLSFFFSCSPSLSHSFPFRAAMYTSVRLVWVPVDIVMFSTAPPVSPIRRSSSSCCTSDSLHCHCQSPLLVLHRHPSSAFSISPLSLFRPPLCSILSSSLPPRCTSVARFNAQLSLYPYAFLSSSCSYFSLPSSLSPLSARLLASLLLPHSSPAHHARPRPPSLHFASLDRPLPLSLCLS